jgi:hypothetical protein
LKNYKFSLKVDPKIKPTQQPAYPIPFSLIPFVEKKLKKLKEAQIIEDYDYKKHGPLTYVVPMHPVEKKDDKGVIYDARITSNAKQLNNALIKQKRHIPSLLEIQYELNGAEWFSKFDFNEAFNQGEFDDQSVPLTATATIFGIVVWNRLNMGISVASELFQEAMEILFKGLPGTKVALDDVLVYGRTKEECYERQSAVLTRIRESGMTLNKKKCKFLVQEINFFGMTINKNGISANEKALQSLMDCEAPTTVKEVHSFLGMTSYFKHRTPHQSTTDLPLRKLLNKHNRFKWEKEEQRAYEILKESVITDSLAHFDSRLQTELICDASPVGGSYFLTQLDKNSDRWLIRCGSHAFTKAELNYSHIEKEAFTCVWAIRNCHIYTHGRPINCITDSLGVQKIFNEDKIRKHTPVRFIKWKAICGSYNITWIHRPGDTNIADFLSRRQNLAKPTPNDVSWIDTDMLINQIVEENIPSDISIQELIDATNEDIVLQALIKRLSLKHKPKHKPPEIHSYEKIIDEFSCTDTGIVIRNSLIVIPSTLQTKVISYAHQGHGGSTLMKRLLRNICWFPGMDIQIEKCVEDCIACACNTDTTNVVPLLPSKIPPSKWHTVAIDFSSKTPSNDYTLVAKDEHSREILAKISKTMTSEEAINICKRLFTLYGIPSIIKSDNGPAFSSREFAEFAKKYKFFHRKVTPYHPAANGSVEAAMKPQNKAIRCASVESSSWKSLYSKYLERYRATPHVATGFSPNMLMFGKDNCNILPQVVVKPPNQNILDLVQRNDALAKEKMRLYADGSQHAKLVEFLINCPVLFKWDRSNKHMPLFDPYPYRISSQNGHMLTAIRENHTITRNSSKFKIISEKCFKNAMELIKASSKIKRTTKTTYIITPFELNFEPGTKLCTPPQTPLNFVQPLENALLIQATPVFANALQPSTSAQATNEVTSVSLISITTEDICIDINSTQANKPHPMVDINGYKALLETNKAKQTNQTRNESSESETSTPVKSNLREKSNRNVNAPSSYFPKKTH